MKTIKKVFNIRKKIFICKKYKKYCNTLDELSIPKYYDYTNCIPKCFSNINYNEINKYQYGNYKKIYDIVKNDILYINSNNINDTVVFVIHPFYPILRHSNFLIDDNNYLKKYILYEKKMIKLLKNSHTDIVLVESPDSFMRYTYSFLKYGKIKRVLLTRHSEGYLLNLDDLKLINNVKRATIIGCYKNLCISDFISQIDNIKIIEKQSLIMNRKTINKKPT